MEAKYLLSQIRKNRHLPEIGFHFDVVALLPIIVMASSCLISFSVTLLLFLYLCFSHSSYYSSLPIFFLTQSVRRCGETKLQKVDDSEFCFNRDCMNSKPVL